VAGWNEYLAKAGGVNKHNVIHQPDSVVSQCGAGVWLNGLLVETSADLREAVDVFATMRYTNPPLLTYLLTYYFLLRVR